MLKPTKETVERISKIYGKFAELSDEVTLVLQELKPLADMEKLDEDTGTLIEHASQLEENFDIAFIASEELTGLLNRQ